MSSLVNHTEENPPADISCSIGHPFALHNDVILGKEDYWYGKTDPKTRKTIQNRLNQRNRRKRLRSQRQQADPKKPPTSESKSSTPIREASDELGVTPSTTPTTATLEHMAQLYYFGSPRADFLLTLIQFNVFRALLQNTTTLGIPFDWLGDVADSAITKGLFNSVAPSSLQPTALQRNLPHHPWSDLFPFPRLRDNILRACDGREDLEDAICAAMVGWCNSPSTRVGLIVWGEPWDPSGWEVTEGFCKTWGWLLSGCEDLIEHSNRWRRVRDERPLILEELLE